MGTVRPGQGFDELLLAARLGRAWALRVLFDRYAGRVFAYARARGAEDPDDVTSEVFAAAFTSLERFDGDEVAFRSWLFTIAHRRLVDAHRRRARRVPTTPLQVVHEPQPARSAEAAALEADEVRRVRQVLDRLAPDQRDVLLLRVLGDLTVEQVARRLGKSPGAVKQLQRRGLAAAARVLAEEGDAA